MTVVSQRYVHSACLLANAIFGLGSIVGALGLPATNPLAFTFVREICSGSLLWLLSLLTSNEEDRRRDALAFLRLGFFLFLNQAGYIVGIQLAGPVTGSVWQPSAPIFTVAISMAWGWERWNVRRFTGVLIAFGGCAAMILLSDRHHDTTHGGVAAYGIGNVLFWINCSSTAFYILLSKPLLEKYPALTVTAWSYLVASLFMWGAALASTQLESVATLICPACGTQSRAFAIPMAALPALAYYIVFQSVASWGLILWANQYATGTLVVGYTVLQPVTSLFFTTLFLAVHWVASCKQPGNPSPCLNEPGMGTLCGMVGVFCGLWLVVQSEPMDPTTLDNRLETETIACLTDYGSVPLKMTTKDSPEEYESLETASLTEHA